VRFLLTKKAYRLKLLESSAIMPPMVEQMDSVPVEVSKTWKSQKEAVPEANPLVRSLFATEHSRDFDAPSDSSFVTAVLPRMHEMFQERDKYRMQLGLVFVHVPFDHFPSSVNSNIEPAEEVASVTLLPRKEEWYLCDTSEQLLGRSIADHATIAIGDSDEPSLLVKVKGKKTALCVKDTRTEDGKLFVRGNWYSPDLDLKADILDAFYKGQGRMDFEEGSWILMRGVKSNDGIKADELLETASKVAAENPEYYPEGRWIMSMDGEPIRIDRETYASLEAEEH